MPDGMINDAATTRPTLDGIDTAIDAMTGPLNDLVFGLRALDSLLGEVSDGGGEINDRFAPAVVFMTQRLASLASDVLCQQVEASNLACVAAGKMDGGATAKS